MIIPRLADKASDLILQAVADLEEIETDPRFGIDMTVWFDRFDDICHVCFAGAVLAAAGNKPEEDHLMPHFFPPYVQCKLYALDEFRCGRVELGLNHLARYMPRRLPEGVPYTIGVTPYEKSPTIFKAQMRVMAQDLARVGL